MIHPSSFPRNQHWRRSLGFVAAGAVVVALGVASAGCDLLSPPGGYTSSGNPITYLDPSTPDEDGTNRPMMPSQDPQIQGQGCGSATCGNAFWKVNFLLPQPAATSGWIVQEISFTRNITGSGASTLPDAMKQAHYWEGFYVKQGAVNCVYFSAIGFDDLYEEQDHPDNTMGTTTWIGKAKFYEGTLPVDFVRQNPNTGADALRSTTTSPPFWDGTGTEHDLTVTWDCTPGNDVHSMQRVPDKCLGP